MKGRRLCEIFSLAAYADMISFGARYEFSLGPSGTAMGRIEKTVFISYRRHDAGWANAVFIDLTHHGYDVFIDYDGIGSGIFETAILETLEREHTFLSSLLAPH